MATNIAEERIYLIEAPYPKAKDYTYNIIKMIFFLDQILYR